MNRYKMKFASIRTKILVLAFMLFIITFFSGTLLAQLSSLNPLTNPTTDEVREIFSQGPDRNYSTAPLWVWNDLLTEEQIRSTLRDLASQNVKQAFVHPRPGLMTPYLSEDWFKLWKAALDEAEKLDMNIWIYDENSYPSGFAGGFVPKAMPDSRGKGLVFENVSSLDKIGDDILFIYQKNQQNRYQNVTEEMKKAGSLSQGDWLIAKLVYAGTGSWFGGTFYVDLLKKGVTEKFLKITHEAYKREVGDQFGKRLPGIFTDEPHLQTAGGITWTEDLPEYFEKRFGYSLIDHLPLLVSEQNSSVSLVSYRQFRHNFQQVLLEMFIERWSKPNFEFCESNRLEFTGHYWEHGWPDAGHGPDNMAMYAWHHRPAIDLLTNNWSDSVNAQVGNTRAVRELGSVANQLGRSRTLSETYGAGGWDLRFEDMKRIADWSYALGVNTTDEHLSYITIRGARKHDHPQSFSYHASWWAAYNEMENYHRRVSYLLSQGKQENHLLILQPTTTVWMYQGTPQLGALGQSFADFVRHLEAAQIEYDLGSEDIIERLGKIATTEINRASREEKTALTVGNASYDQVVLPAEMENLNRSTLLLLNDFAKQGGSIYCVSKLPVYVDGKTMKQLDSETADIFKEFLERFNKTVANSKEMIDIIHTDFQTKGFRNINILISEDFLYDELLSNCRFRLSVVKSSPTSHSESEHNSTDKEFMTDKEISTVEQTGTDKIVPNRPEKLFHHRRTLANGDLIFLCNSDLENSVQGFISCPPKQGKRWIKTEILELQTGKTKLYPADPMSMNIEFDLGPCGSMAFLLTDETQSEFEATEKQVPQSFPPQKFIQTTIQPESKPEVKRINPNVLVVDYCDLTIGEEKWNDLYFFQANDTLWKKVGFPNGNPWNTSVQFKDELISKKFDPQTGFEATYFFELDEDFVESICSENPIHAVVEASHLYQIFCNGKSVAAQEGDWFLDRSFGKIDISQAVQPGKNSLTISVSPMNMFCEIMPIFILGNFSLKSQEKGFLVQTAQPLQFEFDEEEMPDYVGHSTRAEGVSWLSSGINYEKGVADLAPTLSFVFNSPQEVYGVRIWNYAEQNLTVRGVQQMTIKNPNFPKEEAFKTFELKQTPEGGVGNDNYPETILFETPLQTDKLLFQIDSNHCGIKFPVPQTDLDSDRFLNNQNDNGFVGLSEVEFLTKDDSGKLVPIKNVKVSSSSELSQNRRAEFLIDESGLTPSPNQRPTWNNQGMPFYSSEISYIETFNLENFDDFDSAKQDSKTSTSQTEQTNYYVKLPRIGSLENTKQDAQWNAAVAKVVVNDQFAGYIYSEPCELNVSQWLKQGENRIEVILIGTPKNIFGPHHAGKLRGSAWPGNFFFAPQKQPSGYAYDVIPYGLLTPFVLLQKDQIKSN